MRRGGLGVAASQAECRGLEAAHGDGEDASETAQDVVAFAALAPSEPGIGAGVELNGENFLFGDRQIVEANAKLRVLERDNCGVQIIGPGRLMELELNDGFGRDFDGFTESNAGSAIRHVDGFAGDETSIWQLNEEGRGDLEAHGGAALHEFARDRGANAENDRR